MFNFCKLVVLIILIQVTDPINTGKSHFSPKLSYNFSVSSSDLFIKNEGEMIKESMQLQGE